MIDPPAPRIHVPVPVITHDDAGTCVRFACTGALGDVVFDVRINRRIDPSAAALGAACASFFLWPALTAGASLELEAPLPAMLHDNLGVLQEIYATWYPREFDHGGQVLAPPAGPDGPAADPRAVFFSGGVDSTYSLLRHRDQLSALIFVVGFDIPVRNKPLAEGVSATLRAAAERYGLPMIEIATDLRDFSDRHVHWGSHYCGAAMAGMAHLLTADFGEIIVPGSVTWTDLVPFGTHPFTDEKWSSPAMRIQHDSCDVDRLEKIRVIAADGEAMTHLRVCWRNPENSYNCCRCEKCVRAIANLRALGALEAATTFPLKPGMDDYRALEIDHHIVVPFVEQTIGEARRSGDDVLADALAAAVLHYEVARLEKVPKEFLADLPGSVVWRDDVFPVLREAIVAAAIAGDPTWARAKILNMLAPEDRHGLAGRSKRRWWRFWQ